MTTPHIKTNQGHQTPRYPHKIPGAITKKYMANKRNHYFRSMIALHAWGCSAHHPARHSSNLKHVQRFFIDAHGKLDKQAY